MNPRLTLTEHQRRAEAVNNVLEDIIRLYRGELSVCRAAFHFREYKSSLILLFLQKVLLMPWTG
ncbi:hypothetical protein KYE047_22500 [Escherichia coli]